MKILSKTPPKTKSIGIDDHGITGEIPLHWAARNGHANVVALLANERVDINALNKTGESALLIASRYGHVDVVQALLERGASATIQDQQVHLTPRQLRHLVDFWPCSPEDVRSILQNTNTTTAVAIAYPWSIIRFCRAELQSRLPPRGSASP
ncbi:unnamed protein product, partial [Strongylus vulgaris]